MLDKTPYAAIRNKADIKAAAASLENSVLQKFQAAKMTVGQIQKGSLKTATLCKNTQLDYIEALFQQQ